MLIKTAEVQVVDKRGTELDYICKWRIKYRKVHEPTTPVMHMHYLLENAIYASQCIHYSREAIVLLSS
jgi:hypothetical protein